MNIEINWLTDTFECDDCGVSFADGAIVRFEDGVEIHMIPHAHCYDGDHYNSETIYKEILRRLGHTVKDNYRD
jgi:hypothetical protein